MEMEIREGVEACKRCGHTGITIYDSPTEGWEGYSFASCNYCCDNTCCYETAAEVIEAWNRANKRR